MLTGLPDCATARMKSVWRHRKAGVCSTSTTEATCAICSSEWTSVNTGSCSSRFTLARISKPLSRPGPRKVLPLERLALSKLLLKMKEMPSAEVISLSVPAVSICNCSDSMTQGPAIRKIGRSRPTSNPHSFIPLPRQSLSVARGPPRGARDARGGSARRPSGHDLQGLARRLMIQGGFDEGVEQGVAGPGGGLEFGVELNAHKPGMNGLRQLDNVG